MSLVALLAEFRPCFTARTFVVFCALACGFVAQTGRRTVCGMLVGARLSQVWSHHRAHRFFSAARWSPEQLTAVLARLLVRLLVSDGQAVRVAIDDTLFHRRGPKVHAASWFHDGSATGAHKVGYGNNWVITAIVVALPFLDRPLALPVGFALVHKGTDDSRLTLARRLVERLAAAPPDRAMHVVADSAYAGRTLRTLPACITWTTRLHRLAPTRRPQQPLPRSWPRVLRQPDPARTPQDQPHPPTRSTRLHRHPHPSGVTTSPGDSSFSDQATGSCVASDGRWRRVES